MVLDFCYAYKGWCVDCKSEGNILAVENEEKGDVHFCNDELHSVSFAVPPYI